MFKCWPGSRCLLWLLLGIAMPAWAARPAAVSDGVLAGTVTRVIDGDTIDVLLASGRIRVRLHGVDAPEAKQAGGLAATTWLTQQLRDQAVLLEPVSQDRYERLVAVVYLQQRNINRELVQYGHAWAYRRYMRRSDRDLCALEHSARRAQVGLWSDVAARAPWEYRATTGKGPFTSFGNGSADECRKAIGH